MYNENLKEKFIKECVESVTTRESYRQIFNALEPYEKEWGADINTKSADDCSIALDNITGIKIKGKLTRVSLLKKYLKWCVDNHIQGAIYDLDNLKLGNAKLKRRTVGDPQDLQCYLDLVFEKEREKTVDNAYRAYIWLAYGGAKECDALEIKGADVDVNQMIVSHGDNIIYLYDEGLYSINNCINEKQFLFKHPLYDDIWKPRAGGDILVRGFKTPKLLSMRAYIARKFKAAVEEHKTDLELSYSRIWISGLFYRMYAQEQNGETVDFSIIAYNIAKERDYESKSGENFQTRVNRLIKSYSLDYERWKQIFHCNN